MRFKKLGGVARGGIEPPTRGFSVRRRQRFGDTKPKTGRDFSEADRTAPPDRAYPEQEARKPDARPAGLIRFNGLGASRPNFFRTWRRTEPRRVRLPSLSTTISGRATGLTLPDLARLVGSR